MSRVAAVDCGTNTIRLLVADLDAATGEQRDLVREMRIVRLGQDVDRTGRLAEQALARTFTAVEEYAALVAQAGADTGIAALRFCATSASRDADNAEVFVEGVRQRVGVRPEVLTGDEEAQLSYTGATRVLAGLDVPGPVLVVDIGGGSTELILGPAADDRDGEVRARSLDIGSVRLTERLMPSDPPTDAEAAAARSAIDEAVAGSEIPVEEAGTVIGVAGTVTTVAAVSLGLTGYDRDRVHHSWLSKADVAEVTARLLALTAAEREGLHIPAGRADVIAAGALILDRVLAGAGVGRLLVSESDILDGIAWSLV
ncbi:MAG TPA: exopolyphosphatase [Nocardioidaceae bacterium]|nr:exopolyphosphatase [Nocardioidaceae bacterium]